MSRRQAPRLTLAHLAKELAGKARDLHGPGAALVVFQRFTKEHRGLLEGLDHDAVTPAGQLWELMQRELDAGRRRQRGMFFTPRSLVEFIIRGVQERLPQLGRGRRVHVIDPACGYGGFLIDAARSIKAARFTGLEIDGPTCDVARMLAKGSHDGPAADIIQVNPLLAGESLRATIMGLSTKPLGPVIVGNPPWSNFGRQNRGEWIGDLLQDYRAGLAERKSNLADDAIKFIRWAQHWIDEAGAGILAFVTPSTWLAGLTHRRMRESLLHSFDEIAVLDLHGEPGDADDENVFGVRSGVAVLLAVKTTAAASGGSRTVANRVSHASLRGSREAKLAALAMQPQSSIRWRTLRPRPPEWLLAPADTSRASRHRRAAASEYAEFWPLDRIFRHYTSGVQTKNDAVFVGFTREHVARQVRAWLKEHSEAPAFDAAHIRPYLVAPFDRRWVYYDPRVIGRARLAVMPHMLQPNLGLVFMRQSTNPGEYDHFLAVDCLVSDRVFYSRHGAPFLAPLWLCKAPTSGRDDGHNESVVASDSQNGQVERGITLTNGQSFDRQANFTEKFWTAVAAAIGQPPEPIGIFHYLYAIAYSPGYRGRFAEHLRRGFPRLPLPANRDEYRRLSELGGRLVALHVATTGGTSPGAGLLSAKDSAQAGDGFRLGGYDVLKRWAKPRRAAGLSARDERELARLALIGCQTSQLMEEIDVQSRDQWSG